MQPLVWPGVARHLGWKGRGWQGRRDMRVRSAVCELHTVKKGGKCVGQGGRSTCSRWCGPGVARHLGCGGRGMSGGSKVWGRGAH